MCAENVKLDVSISLINLASEIQKVIMCLAVIRTKS